MLAKRKQTHKKIESLGNSFRFHAIGVLLLLLEVGSCSIKFCFLVSKLRQNGCPLELQNTLLGAK